MSGFPRVTIYELIGPDTRRTVARVFVPGDQFVIEVRDRHGKIRYLRYDVSDPGWRNQPVPPANGATEQEQR